MPAYLAYQIAEIVYGILKKEISLNEYNKS